VIGLQLLLQTSALIQPLYLAPEPPRLRSARHILILEKPSGEPGDRGRSSEEALALSQRLLARLRAGEPFDAVAREHSQGPCAHLGGELGSFAPGMLPAELDRFLFEAEIGGLSGPLITRGTVHLLQRVETHAAVLQIVCAGSDDASLARARATLTDLRAGADFAGLAAERSEDEASRGRRGQLAIFERDRLEEPLKSAAFGARIGQVVGPIKTAVGYHLIKRVPRAELDERLAESRFVRLRAVLVSHVGAVGAAEDLTRTPGEALALATALRRRVSAGEALARVAARFNEDPGGKERGGDLGWVHRGNPALPGFLEEMFAVEIGFVSDPLWTSRGYVVVRREG
jgi:parvulin-like peptidyl-prolyl isomerase